MTFKVDLVGEGLDTFETEAAEDRDALAAKRRIDAQVAEE